MVENIEVIANLFIVVFSVVILVTILLFILLNKKKRKGSKEQILNKQVSMFISSGDEKVEAEVLKAIKAICGGVILNEKQVNHAENHNDINEVKKFEKFNHSKFFDMTKLGETVYGKY